MRMRKSSTDLDGVGSRLVIEPLYTSSVAATMACPTAMKSEENSCCRKYVLIRVVKMRVSVSSLNGVIETMLKWRRKRSERSLRPPPGGAMAQMRYTSCSVSFVVSLRSYQWP